MPPGICLAALFIEGEIHGKIFLGMQYEGEIRGGLRQ